MDNYKDFYIKSKDDVLNDEGFLNEVLIFFVLYIEVNIVDLKYFYYWGLLMYLNL